MAVSTLATAPAPTTPSSTRRANVPPQIKDWIFSKASLFLYYEEGARTKEEKQLFIHELTKKLNSRFGKETGEWDEIRTGNQVRNLKKERLLLATPKRDLAPPSGTPSTPSLTAMEQLLLDWQATLVATSHLNSTTLARHATNRGACNEELVKGFLSSILSSKLIGIGSGELFDDVGTTVRRQLDVVLYNPEYPCLLPARYSGSSSTIGSYLRESVMSIIEVKTTLTNQDLIGDVSTAASLLAPLPIFLFAFDSQSSLKAIDVCNLPGNICGIFTLSHGSIVRSNETGDWQVIHPSQRAPLIVFYCSVLTQLSRYAKTNACTSLVQVLSVLEKHISNIPCKETTPVMLENALTELDLNSL